jgi:uncharacterized membrane protein (UPF0127 family)
MLHLARTGAVIARAPRVAATPWARAIGVLGTPFRGYDALVIPRCASVHTWFLGVSLDLLFVDGEGRVLRVIAPARPWGFHFGPRGTRAVIELPAGALCGIAVSAGDSIEGLPSG